MKKIASIMMILTLMISPVLGFPVESYAETYGDFEYIDLQMDMVQITNYTGNDTEVVIPSTINGKVVTSIADGTFSMRGDYTSITIPSCVSEIEGDPFGTCPTLTSIKVEQVSVEHPLGAPGLVSVDGILYSWDCSTLIRCPEGKEGTYTTPESVTAIGYCAFAGCRKLTNITISNKVISIGDGAFYWCEGLTKLVIPDSVKNLGRKSTFGDCSNLTNIVLPKNINGDDEEGNYMFSGCSNLKTITLPNGLRMIGQYAFSDCSSLTSVVIPDSVIEILPYAFSECKSLKSVVIPDKMDYIMEYAFMGCKNLTSITIPDSVTLIEKGVFYGCNKLTIYGISRSYAEKYAKEEGINFVATDKAETTDSTSELTKPKRVTITSAKNTSKKTIKVIWKKINANGYQIQIARNKKFTKNKMTYKTTKRVYKLKKLKKGKTYYIRVRAFNKNGTEKKYGKWSKIKKVKVTK